MHAAPTFSAAVLELDREAAVAKIVAALRQAMAYHLKRRGLVVALSGGVDSSVTLALAVRALGAGRVLALRMPEKHSAANTGTLSAAVADHFGVESIQEEITPILAAVGFYRRYDEAVRRLIPEYGDAWRSKLVLNSAAAAGFPLFSLVAEDPEGARQRKQLDLHAYLAIVAATNCKQRVRKLLEYYHADRLHYAVAGTPNRLEYDQGFFVKLGDGAADVKPIAHLYKSQVYQLAEYLGVPAAVTAQPPSTDTYSLPQGQDEFYFSLPYRQLDLCLYAKNRQLAPEVVAPVVGLTPGQVAGVFKEIEQKRATTRYLHLAPILAEPVAEIRNYL